MTGHYRRALAVVGSLLSSLLVASAEPAAIPSSRVLTAQGLPASDGYFPIAVWLQDPRNAPRYQAAGINLYVALWKGPTREELNQLRAAHMPVICTQNAVGLESKDDPIIAGWMHGDEPDNAQDLPGGKGYGPPIPPEIIVQDYARIRAADPSRPVMLNLGQGVAWDDWRGRGVRTRHPEDYPDYVKGGDIVSFDIYPATHKSPEVAGRLEFVAQGVERLTGWTRGEKPVWSCIECTHISNARVKPTPSQVRSEVWMALIRGARGLIYFVHQFQPVFHEAALLDDPDMLAAVTAINRQIRDLAPVLNSPAVAGLLTVQSSVSAAPIATMVKRHQNAVYVFAVNLANEPARATFSLKELSSGADVEVLAESRRVAVQDKAFADEFAPYAVHLYRLSR